MSFDALLKALRVRPGIKLTRKQLVAELRKQGIRTSVNSIERIEHGRNRTLTLILAMLRIYNSRAKIRPGVLEAVLMASANGESLSDRRKRYIATNLKHCKDRQLAEIEKIIRKASEE